MRCPSQRGPADNSSWPNPWAPVPQSRTISVPSSPRTSTHDVLPPWRSVSRPGLAKDPRVPQNRISILVPSHLRDAAPRTPVPALPQQLVSGNERTTPTRPPLIVVWLVRSVKEIAPSHEWAPDEALNLAQEGLPVHRSGYARSIKRCMVDVAR